MSDLSPSITLVRMEPQPAARAYAFGPQPEFGAQDRMKAYLAATGIALDGDTHRLFGYNNPNPSAGSPNYGYELLLTGVPAPHAGETVEPGLLEGGLYAVSPFTHPDSDYGETVPAAWVELDAWVAAHGYQAGTHQWLEEHGADFRLRALYYPLAE